MASSPQHPAARHCSVCRTPYGGAERFCPLDGGAVVDADAADPMVGRTIDGRYFVRRMLAQGGMGVVYEAEHIGLDKRVAIKFIADRFTGDREALHRFHREARTASRIGHENIVDITDIGETDDGKSYLVMELLEGMDLGAVLRATGQLDPTRAVHVVGQVLRGLHAAHGMGIVHRDMKPENVFLTTRGGAADFVKIMDFGISKVVAAREARVRLTDTGVAIGTPIYMAPEQVEGKSDIDHRADIYAVGVMLYEMLAGRPPFTSSSYMALVSQHLSEPPPPLRALQPEVPEPLAAAVHRALEKNPARRFADALEFARALPAAEALRESWDSRATVGPRTAPAPRAAPLVTGDLPAAERPDGRGWRGPVIAAAALAVIAGGVLTWQLAGEADRPAQTGAAAADEQAAAATGDDPATAATAATAAIDTGAGAPAGEVAADDGAAETGAPGPEVAPITTATLEVDSAPRGAHVFLDGAHRGRTPLTLDAVPVGSYLLRLEHRGYEEVEAEKAVRPGHTESFFAVLARRGSGRKAAVTRSGRDRTGASRAEPAKTGAATPQPRPQPKADPAAKTGARPEPEPQPQPRPTSDPAAKTPPARDGKPNPYLDP